MKQRLPTTVPAVNASGKAMILRDHGLFATGGQLAMEPGVEYLLPIEVFRRAFRLTWLVRSEVYQRMLAAEQAKQDAAVAKKGRKKGERKDEDV